jgi:multiple sugar transport system substrate-binding protein
MKALSRLTALLVVVVLFLSACGGAPETAAPTAPANAPQPTANASQPTAAAAQESPTSAAPAATGDKVPLTLWIFEGEDQFLPKLKETFEAKYPNISLEFTTIPEDQYVTKIDTALAANDPPDIGFVYGGQQRWLKAGKYLPLDEMFKDNNIKVEDFNQNAMSLYCLYEGKYYCVGSYTGAVVLIYNKDMFDAAGLKYPSATEPMTIDQYAALAAQLSKKSDDINQRVWGGSAGSTYWYMDWTTHFSADGKQAVGYINDEATVHTYDVLAKMVKDGSAPSDADTQLLGDTDILAQKKQAMSITDNTAIATLEEQGIRYGVAPPPVEKQGDQPFIITWSDAFGVFSQSKHPKEAMQFLSFLGTEGNKMRVELFKTMPLNLKLADDLNWAGENPGRKEMVETVKEARSVIFVPGFYEITGPMNDAFNAMVENQKQPQEAMDEAAAQIQDSLNKAWETWNQIK